MVKHRLAADDEDPGIHDGVEGIETESCQVLSVTTKWANGVDETCNLMKERVEVGDVSSTARQSFQNHIYNHSPEAPHAALCVQLHL